MEKKEKNEAQGAPGRKFAKLENTTVEVISNDQVEMRRMKGRAFYNPSVKRFDFEEYLSGKKRSKLLAVEEHGRVLHVGDNRYKMHFNFTTDEKHIKEQLLLELRQLLKNIDEKQKKQKK